MEAFFIVMQFGCNTGDLMNKSARAAPGEAGVSERRVGQDTYPVTAS